MKLVILIVLTGILSWLMTVLIYRTVSRLGWLSLPKARSSHHQPTAQCGGLAIVIASTMIGGVLTIEHSSYQVWGIMLLGLPMAWIGLLDDVRELSISLRLCVQMALCAGMLALLGNLPGVDFLPGLVLSGWLLSFFLMLTGVWWINLFNFMDGIDGFAGLQAMFMLILGATLSAWGHPDALLHPVWMLLLGMAAATLGFLLCNLPPARIFMGDVGSTWLPFMIFSLALITVQQAWMTYTVWLVISAVFITDATATLLIRMMTGERWFQPHCNHAYQHLARRASSDRKTAHRSVDILLTAINIFWLTPIAVACVIWPEWSFECLMLAYLPLIVGVVMIGAGRAERSLSRPVTS